MLRGISQKISKNCTHRIKKKHSLNVHVGFQMAGYIVGFLKFMKLNVDFTRHEFSTKKKRRNIINHKFAGMCSECSESWIPLWSYVINNLSDGFFFVWKSTLNINHNTQVIAVWRKQQPRIQMECRIFVSCIHSYMSKRAVYTHILSATLDPNLFDKSGPKGKMLKKSNHSTIGEHSKFVTYFSVIVGPGCFFFSLVLHANVYIVCSCVYVLYKSHFNGMHFSLEIRQKYFCAIFFFFDKS